MGDRGAQTVFCVLIIMCTHILYVLAVMLHGLYTVYLYGVPERHK